VSSLEQAHDLPKGGRMTWCSAWQRGDTAWFEGEMASEFGNDPALYQSVLAARNRKWMPKIEALLNDDKNYLVIVGTGHSSARQRHRSAEEGRDRRHPAMSGTPRNARTPSLLTPGADAEPPLPCADSPPTAPAGRQLRLLRRRQHRIDLRPQSRAHLLRCDAKVASDCATSAATSA
jgi:hypothetical protein